LAETLGKAELKGRTFGDTEFVIGHSGSTVPERSGVALSFCGRREIGHTARRWLNYTAPIRIMYLSF
ncbi:hypothetical protein, partial [Pseudomonas veronii]|uniref:hypothetical protein n=1 Tax=Pseudomonas veronii TaxID=76761 RepID=UPI001CA39C30